MRPRAEGRLRPVTAKERLLERAMTFSEAEAEEALRLLDARRDEAEADRPAARTDRPHDRRFPADT